MFILQFFYWLSITIWATESMSWTGRIHYLDKKILLVYSIHQGSLILISGLLRTSLPKCVGWCENRFSFPFFLVRPRRSFYSMFNLMIALIVSKRRCLNFRMTWQGSGKGLLWRKGEIWYLRMRGFVIKEWSGNEFNVGDNFWFRERYLSIVFHE